MFIRFVGPDCDHMDGHAFGLFHFFMNVVKDLMPQLT